MRTHGQGQIQGSTAMVRKGNHLGYGQSRVTIRVTVRRKRTAGRTERRGMMCSKVMRRAHTEAQDHAHDMASNV